MALVLSGERPAAARMSISPFSLLVRWFAKARTARAQRLALDTLFELEAHRLDDLGINRGDLFDAMHAAQHPTRLLADRRARHLRG